MNSIRFYKYNGKIVNDVPLTDTNIGETNGMMIRCTMKNGNVFTGYSDPYKTHENNSDVYVSDYIYLWTWKNIDEDKHELIGIGEEKYDHLIKKIDISNISSIDAILYSNPRWGGIITNNFYLPDFIDDVEDNEEGIEIPEFLKNKE